jgi:hypothetical protein
MHTVSKQAARRTALHSASHSAAAGSGRQQAAGSGKQEAGSRKHYQRACVVHVNNEHDPRALPRSIMEDFVLIRVVEK